MLLHPSVRNRKYAPATADTGSSVLSASRRVASGWKLASEVAARMASRERNSNSVSASQRKPVTIALSGSARGSFESLGVNNTRHGPPPGRETNRHGTVAPPNYNSQPP